MPADLSFAHYCCELLASAGPCTARRMFGGFGISTGGLNIALLADLGRGDTLWLKADEETRGLFEAAGCVPFVYEAKGKAMKLNYYSAPEDAMESPQLMAQWARLSLECALKARAAKAARARPAIKLVAKRGRAASNASATSPTSPATRRADAVPASPKASRKSRSG
ncbi:MAG: TfoX/Sxy family protein [Polaromonas sp.]|uniref:TfoX/Sxy family protein n=1 Tax=Polaromonas sp. TaxID=1869339 RepID=UPI0027226875|nr:TfoX/Sxy family protein [Polaromonas sp.]MDO9113959.1 TfoX/Sxy family protein [Polaromonas sp.]MDP1884900.1 TfoX/Sxy family protein [Polaromonas sp.]